jgi:hypothetical protein
MQSAHSPTLSSSKAIPLHAHCREMRHPKKYAIAALLASALMTACGGGGGGGSSASNSAVLNGVAATGAALANAPVTVTNSLGVSPCQESSISTNAFGSYTCTLKTGQVAPFFVVVTDPTGSSAPLVSVATTTPAVGTPLTVNATPLTTAILAQLASDGNALTLVASNTVVAADLQNVTNKVVAQLNGVLTSINAPVGYNPFSTSITAATSSGTGNTADMVLDVVKVVTDPATGRLALTTVSDPTPKALATVSTTGATVTQPSAGVASLSQVAQVAARAFAACFALPVSQRVISTNLTIPLSAGGPAIVRSADACESITASTTNGAGMNYLHNGYIAGQHFYDLMTSDAMTGAVFSVPEIMAYYPGNTSLSATNPDRYDHAVINIRYVDSAGNPGNKITVTSRLPGTSTAQRDTEWWLTGNQQSVDVSLKTQARRVEQMKGISASSTISTFMSGISLYVNTTGPGSTNLNLARISGPGLPGNGTAGTGLVFKVSPTSDTNYMDLFNKTGSLTVGSICGNNAGTTSCPNLWLARTTGIASTAATTLDTNPTGQSWAQSTDGFTPASFIRGADYKVELFYGSNTGTADVVLTKTLLTDLTAATQLVNLPWNTLGALSQAAFNPTNVRSSQQTALPIDWVQNKSAQQIASVQAVGVSGSFSGFKTVPKGESSVIMDNVTIPAYNITTGSRTVLMNYRMMDGSTKVAVYSYNN